MSKIKERAKLLKRTSLRKSHEEPSPYGLPFDKEQIKRLHKNYWTQQVA
jgi:uncharacterized lipoprotein YbaY